jgi:hypothetical protein
VDGATATGAGSAVTAMGGAAITSTAGTADETAGVFATVGRDGITGF